MPARNRSLLLQATLALLLAVSPVAGWEEGLLPATTLSSKFGVHGSSNRRPDVVSQTTSVGAGWIRLNADFADPDPDFKAFLDAGVNVIITFANRDPSNVDTTYGTPIQWIHAGFPYLSRSTYQQRIRDVVTPLLPSLANGRQLWLQCENEIGDASVGSGSVYWRGTTDQYLVMLSAFFEVARSLSPQIVVVLTSFASVNLDVAIDPASPNHGFQTERMTKLLSQGEYDAADLHFYGCDSDIPAKVAWYREHALPGKVWISTENSAPNADCGVGYISWMQNLLQFEQTEATEVPIRLSLCSDNGGTVCLWFSLFDLTGEVDAYNHLGLLDPRVTPPRQKPAYFAFQTFVEQPPPATPTPSRPSRGIPISVPFRPAGRSAAGQ